MKLTQKLHLIMVLFTLAVIGIVSFVVLNVTDKSYFEIEERQFQDELSSLNEIVKDEFDDLDYILNDWAVWDATYNFVQGNDKNYLEENLQQDIFSDLDLEYIYILDNKDRPLYGNRYNHDNGKVEVIDKEAMAVLIDISADTGIVMVDNHLYLYANKGISTNDGKKEFAGRMGFLRIIDIEYLESIEKKTKLDLDFKIEEISKALLPDKEVILEINTQLDHTKDITSTLEVSIPITHSNTEFVLYSKMTNSIQVLGVKYAKETLLILLITLVTFGVGLHYAFSKFVLKRLLVLIDQVSWIRNNGKTEERLGFHGIDEIGILSENINSMLEELDNIHKEVKHYATYDEMTGVFNRRIGYDILDECVRNKVKNDIDFSIVYIDIDGLKKVNDNFGHKLGDSLIEDVVQVIKSVQDNVHLVRLGGDEFLAILKNSSLEDAQKYEFHLMEAAKKFNETSERIYTLSFSTGCTQYETSFTIEELLEIADKRMYAEKCDKKELKK